MVAISICSAILSSRNSIPTANSNSSEISIICKDIPGNNPLRGGTVLLGTRLLSLKAMTRRRLLSKPEVSRIGAKNPAGRTSFRVTRFSDTMAPHLKTYSDRDISTCRSVRHES